jgi:hypothetical protein
MSMQAGLPACRDARPVGRGFPLPPSGQVNVQPNNYWSGLEYAPNPGNAWSFNFNNGNQNANDKNNENYAWAVRPGE